MNTGQPQKEPRKLLVTPGLTAPGIAIPIHIMALPTAEGEIGFEEFLGEKLDERFPGRVGECTD